MLDLGLGAHAHPMPPAVAQLRAHAALKSRALALRVAAADFALPPPPDVLEPTCAGAGDSRDGDAEAPDGASDRDTPTAAATALTSSALCELLVALLGEQRFRHLPYRRVDVLLWRFAIVYKYTRKELECAGRGT